MATLLAVPAGASVRVEAVTQRPQTPKPSRAFEGLGPIGNPWFEALGRVVGPVILSALLRTQPVEMGVILESPMIPHAVVLLAMQCYFLSR